jgi:hypothetical protein
MLGVKTTLISIFIMISLLSNRQTSSYILKIKSIRRELTQSAISATSHREVQAKTNRPAFPDAMKHKFLGGAQLDNGDIYAIPSHSDSGEFQVDFTKRLLAEQQLWAKIRLFAAAGLSIGDLLTDPLIT